MYKPWKIYRNNTEPLLYLQISRFFDWYWLGMFHYVFLGTYFIPDVLIIIGKYFWIHPLKVQIFWPSKRQLIKKQRVCWKCINERMNWFYTCLFSVQLDLIAYLHNLLFISAIKMYACTLVSVNLFLVTTSLPKMNTSS